MAVMRGEVDFVYVNLSPLVGHLQSGALKGLAVVADERLEAFPDVPTFAEAGYGDVDVLGWRGVAGPPDLPPEIVKKWEEAVSKTVADKAWLKLVKNLGDMPGYMDAAQYNAFIDKDYKRFRTTFEELGILVD